MLSGRTILGRVPATHAMPCAAAAAATATRYDRQLSKIRNRNLYSLHNSTESVNNTVNTSIAEPE